MKESINPRVGKELNLLISGEIPMALFYKSTIEQIDEFMGQDFSSHVKSGKLKKIRFYIRHGAEKPNLVYTAFSKPDQYWRLHIIRILKKIGQSVWSEDLQKIENIVRGI